MTQGRIRRTRSRSLTHINRWQQYSIIIVLKKLVTLAARQSCIWGAETHEPIATKFCGSGAAHDVSTPANFCQDRLRGFGVARGRILAFSIDLLRRLYNTLALPLLLPVICKYQYFNFFAFFDQRARPNPTISDWWTSPTVHQLRIAFAEILFIRRLSLHMFCLLKTYLLTYLK